MSKWKKITKKNYNPTTRYLVTNNKSAKNNYGDMSHVWISFIDYDYEFYGYTEDGNRIFNLHYFCEIPKP